MGVLDSVIRLKELETAKQQQDVANLQNNVNTFLALKQQNKKDMIDQLSIKATLAGKGLKMGADGGIVRDENLVSPLEKLTNLGQVADAQMKIFNAGGPSPNIGSLLQSGGQVNPQSMINQNLLSQVGPNSTGLQGGTDLENLKPGDVVPTKFDQFGRPEGFELVKKTAAQDKRDVENEELSNQIANVTDLFMKAREEASQVPGFGKPGVAGRVANLTAIAGSKLGNLPTVKVFQDRIGAFATIAAKAAGEVRPTDADIERFSNSLTNLKNNDKENAVQLSQVLKDIESKGQGVLWAEPLVRQFESTTGVPVDYDFTKNGDKPSSKNKTSGNQQFKQVGKFKVRVKS